MGFVDANKYLKEVGGQHAKVLEPTGIGYRDAAIVKEAGFEYAYGMAGNVFGHFKTAGGYLGLAHYLNTGTKDITTNSNKVYVASANSTSRKDRAAAGGSKYGAPVGPYSVCISDVSDGKCGSERTFKPNEYKFSIFAYITGANYSTTVVAGKNGFPSGLTDMGVRMKLQTVGFKASDLQVNGRAYDKEKVNEDVKSFTFTTKRGTLTYEFPTKYNIGTTDGASTDGTMLPVSETKTVKIRVHTVTQTSVMIDYLFDSASLSQGKYIIYDPTVAMKDEGKDDSDDGYFGARPAMPVLALFMCVLAYIAF